MNGPELRVDRRWMLRAISSLPVPVSPVMRTVESVGATLEMRESTVCKAGDVPTISSNMDVYSISVRTHAIRGCQFISAPIAIMNRIRLSENPTLSLSCGQFVAYAGLRWGEIT